ncbi:helix-turn-helix transcriptional regulator [Solihabitans fulvus]|uniref:Helix-turn-helix transcriptional regulator n=1 Tax=Solihabitans fulvus TaxID=1892852 RepID=A0A5B2X4H9_9PSEU|nr:helix-turn-helix transcriptional regulator [Solihabitans fulvus]KAA2258156.1 helix-turn-helix transcriptional regulator [Solihabitans fulvus]
MTAQRTQSLGDLLRQWRKRRRVSQLELATGAEISARHLSFVENGRSMPSREIVLRLAEPLGLALRERNQLLMAAGYAPVYEESGLDAPRMAAVRAMVRRVLAAHEPFPAVVLDRYWNRVEANEPARLFSVGVAEELLQEPVNLMRVCLHPDGLAPRVVNLGEWRAHLLSRLRQQVATTADPELSALYEELAGYPCDQPEPEVELPGPGAIAVPLRLRFAGRELVFFSTVSTFGTPLDVTVAELVLESFFPADDETEAVLRETTWGPDMVAVEREAVEV